MSGFTESSDYFKYANKLCIDNDTFKKWNNIENKDGEPKDGCTFTIDTVHDEIARKGKNTKTVPNHVRSLFFLVIRTLSTFWTELVFILRFFLFYFSGF